MQNLQNVLLETFDDTGVAMATFEWVWFTGSLGSPFSVTSVQGASA